MSSDSRPLTLEEKRAKLAIALQKKLANQIIVAPLSFNQQRLWFVDQIDPGSPLYNITITLQFTGKLEVDRFQAVFDQLVRRQESLRTTFDLQDGQPVQRISPFVSLPIEFLKLADLPGADRRQKTEKLVHQQTRTQFNLSTGPLLRAAIAYVEPQEHIFCLTFHHIISDGWSVAVAISELVGHYSQMVGLSSVAIPELKIQYRDFAIWQRAQLQNVELEKLLTFWKTYLDGARHTLELTTDHPRPPLLTYNGTTHHFRMPTTLHKAMKAFCRREGTTIFTTLLACYAALLYRYSGQQDMLIGVPVNGRERAEVQPLIGYFVNILVVRLDLAQQPTFQELLRRVHKSRMNAQAHQDIPFEKLIEALRPQRSADRNPLVQVVYLHQSFPIPDEEAFPGLITRQLEVHAGFSRFELGLRTEPDAQGINCVIEYNTDLFEASTIARMGDHFLALIGQVVTDPSQLIDEIPLLSEADQSRLTRAR